MRRLLQQLQPPGPRVLGLCPCRAFAVHVYLQYAGDSAAKFYSLEQGEGAAENTIVTTFGRAGTAGQSSTSTYPSPAAALASLRKTEAAKRKKGYTTAAAAAAAAAPTGDAPAAPAAFPRMLAAGESVAVPSSSGAATYRVKCVSVGADGAPEELSCTCVGYAQRRKARGAASTCRHIALVQGEAAEAARLAAAAAAPPPPPELHSAAIAPLIALAHAWAPAVDPAGLLLSEKLDGVRALWHEGRLWSRAGHALHAPPFFTAALPARCTLDGELHMGRGRFGDTVTVARGSGAGAAGERWRGVQYAVFDAPLAGGGFAARLAAAGAALAEGRRAAAASSSGAPAESFAAILPHAPCGGAEDLALQLKEVLEAGGEGLMLRRPEARFSAGRTHDLLKVKVFTDDEALVIGHEGGLGKHVGRVGALRCVLRSGAEFSCGSGLSDAQREAPPAVGTVVSVKYFELTRDGLPRFPVLLRVRGDVSAAEFKR